MQSKGNKGMILQDRVCDNEKEVEMEINQRLVKGDGYRQLRVSAQKLQDYLFKQTQNKLKEGRRKMYSDGVQSSQCIALYIQTNIQTQKQSNAINNRIGRTQF